MVELGTTDAPIAFDRTDRCLQLFDELGDGQPAKEAEHDHLTLPRVEMGKAVQGIVESDQVKSFLLNVVDDIIQEELPSALAAFDGTKRQNRRCVPASRGLGPNSFSTEH